jgi:hypothetical protein
MRYSLSSATYLTISRLVVIVEPYPLVAMNFDCQIILDEFLVIDDSFEVTVLVK